MTSRAKNKRPPLPEGAISHEMVALGRVFRAARERAKLSLVDLAANLGLSINTVRWHEIGHRMLRVDKIHDAARFIDATPADLVEVPNAKRKRKRP